jgi:hypothetical protein
MPAYEVDDHWMKQVWSSCKSDPAEALCVSSEDKTKPEEKPKRFMDCDTSAKYVKPKR